MGTLDGKERGRRQAREQVLLKRREDERMQKLKEGGVRTEI